MESVFIKIIVLTTLQLTFALSAEEPECGQRSVTHVPLVYGGTDSAEGEWPWHAGVFFRNGTTGATTYWCGGTLIATNYVLTAAHCTFSLQIALPATALIVKLGLVNLNSPGPLARNYSLIEIIRHGRYNPENYQYDIALLKTSVDVMFSDYIQPICLPTGDDRQEFVSGVVVGWGYGDGNILKPLLQRATLGVVDERVCLRSNAERISRILAEDGSNYCGGNRNKTNVCEGDSGGGMYVNVEKSWFLRGVTSSGVPANSMQSERCDTTEYVTFSKVAFFSEWISTVQNAKKNNLLDLADCGTDYNDISVPESDKPLFAQYPWVTIQEYKVPNASDVRTVCSGVLIHPQFVLTAGHCICRSCNNTTLKSVRLGEYDLAVNPDTEELLGEPTTTFTQTIDVEEIIHHPNFNNPRYSNDIAILKLSHPADLDTINVKTICLPLLRDYSNEHVISGWKRVNTALTTLQRESARVLDVGKCRERYRGIGVNLTLANSLLCVESERSVDDCYNFLAGTPLKYLKNVDGTNRYFLKGIYAFGSSRCGPTLADVYVDVDFYSRWIEDVDITNSFSKTPTRCIKKELPAWLEELEEIYQMYLVKGDNNAPDTIPSHYMRAIKNKIKGDARTVLCANGNPNTIPGIKRVLSEIYGDQKDLATNLSHLFHMKRGDRNNHKFYTDVKELSTKIKMNLSLNPLQTNDLIEILIVTKYLDNIGEPLASIIRQSKPTTLEDAYQSVCINQNAEVRNRPSYSKFPRQKDNYKDKPNSNGEAKSNPPRFKPAAKPFHKNKAEVHNNEVNDDTDNDKDNDDDDDTDFRSVGLLFCLDELTQQLEDLEEAIVLAQHNIPSSRIINAEEITRIHHLLEGNNFIAGALDFASAYVVSSKESIAYILKVPRIKDAEYDLNFIEPVIFNNSRISISTNYYLQGPSSFALKSLCEMSRNVYVCSSTQLEPITKCIQQLMRGESATCPMERTYTNGIIKRVDDSNVIINDAEISITSNCSSNHRKLKGSFLVQFSNCTLFINDEMYSNINKEVQLASFVPTTGLTIYSQRAISDSRNLRVPALRFLNAVISQQQFRLYTFKLLEFYDGLNMETVYIRIIVLTFLQLTFALPPRGPKCGQRPVTHLPLIYGGIDSEEGEWPWHAGVFFRNGTSGATSYWCGGTLIGSNIVVTAAHCTFSRRVALPATALMVKLGLANLNSPGPLARSYNLKEIIRHGRYNPENFKYDIALLKTSVDVMFSDYVQPICLPAGDDRHEFGSGVVVGWGYGDGNILKPLLQRATLGVVDDYTCLRSNAEHFSRLLAEDGSNYCGGNRNKTNVCEGDSGGGMYVNVQKSWFLRGVASTGVRANSMEKKRCDTTEYVTFSNVSFFSEWISTVQNAKKNNLLDLADCGTDYNDMSVPERDKPLFTQYPWVTIQEYIIPNASDVRTVCSGVLIHSQFILTAGHCICTSCNNTTLKSVRLGEYDLAVDPDTEELLGEPTKTFTQTIDVEKIIRHPKFNNPKYSNDIAILKLSHPADLDTINVKPICLPLVQDYSSELVISGWKRANAALTTLQRESARVLDVDMCRKPYRGIGVELTPANSLLCVEGEKSVGDCYNFLAGTPLQYVKNADGMNRYFLKGIYAFGSSRCGDTLTDVYVDVNFYSHWIERVIKSESGQ
ncbi:uncharacterized protein LOC129766797 [Toxorhynchites rutilus septentrionalis]|uniref:uncharacterized protein LOC129766797 n=1 Tax=Toxorhynchites rutilus septentrionalis TaxID=329112 RepID=UPI00247AFCF0|nr:uncharacterized protein LOC129766797 [Toxorhynchites rutilus septentrionalis]